MRGGHNGALCRKFLHSAITEHLWFAVAENESLLSANLMHAVMLAAMYSHPSANLDKGNDQVHSMYVNALNTLPYIKASAVRRSRDTDELVEEWKRINQADGAVEPDREGAES